MSYAFRRGPSDYGRGDWSSLAVWQHLSIQSEMEGCARAPFGFATISRHRRDFLVAQFLACLDRLAKGTRAESPFPDRSR